MIGSYALGLRQDKPVNPPLPGWPDPGKEAD
jgi:hypothetical protein